MPGISSSKICVPFGGGAVNLPPDAPTGLIVTVIDSNSIKLDWTSNSGGDEDGFNIYYSDDGITFVLLDDTATGIVTYQADGLTENHYWFYVTSYNSNGDSDPTLTVSNTEPLVLFNANTIGWYDFTKTATLTVDGSNLVSAWASRLGGANTMVQGTANQQPLLTATGVLFDGDPAHSDFLTVAVATNQPIFIYLVIKQITWTNDDNIMGGGTSRTLIRQRTSTPSIGIYGGTAFSADDNGLAVGSYGIIRALFHGANSKLITNDNAPKTGDFGVLGGQYIALGYHASTLSIANFEVKEYIYRNVSDSAANEADIYAYLKSKYSL